MTPLIQDKDPIKKGDYVKATIDYRSGEVVSVVKVDPPIHSNGKSQAPCDACSSTNIRQDASGLIDTCEDCGAERA